jgi:hypothetical protein
MRTALASRSRSRSVGRDGVVEDDLEGEDIDREAFPGGSRRDEGKHCAMYFYEKHTKQTPPEPPFTLS